MGGGGVGKNQINRLASLSGQSDQKIHATYIVPFQSNVYVIGHTAFMSKHKRIIGQWKI